MSRRQFVARPRISIRYRDGRAVARREVAAPWVFAAALALSLIGSALLEAFPWH